MKTLRESLFDQDINAHEVDEAVIKNWVNRYYEISSGEFGFDFKHRIVYILDKSTCMINVIDYSMDQLLPDGWSFGTVNGSFDCSGTKIRNLKGAPKMVTGGFCCSDCDNLESLEGGPIETGFSFDCSSCNRLKDLKGAPETVGLMFNCSECHNLKSLKGAPDVVYGDFICLGCKSLTRLTGISKKVGNIIFDDQYIKDTSAINNVDIL